MTRYWLIFTQAIGPILNGMITVTIPLAVASSLAGLLLGLIFVLLRYSQFKLVRVSVKSLVWFLRGTPMLVLLYFLFFGLAELNMVLSSWQTALLAFTLFEAAFMSETIRGALSVIDQGQWEAGLALGLPKRTVLKKVIIPQALPPIAPTLIGYFISAVKLTSLVSNIALSDMLLAGQQFINYYYAPFFIYSIITALYLLMFSGLSYLQNKVDAHYHKSRGDLLTKFLLPKG